MGGATGGIYGNFEGYRTVGDEQLGDLLRSSTVVLDTNVLLDLYRYGDAARLEFLDVLRSLTTRLFIPHQVLKEFWGRRISILEERGAGKSESELNNAEKSALAVVERWGSSTRAELGTVEDLQRDLGDAFTRVRGRMALSQNRLNVSAAIKDTSQDPVLSELEAILEKAVGPAPDQAKRLALVKEGKRRFAEEIPPGYRDGAKEGPDEGTGDFLLWRQIIDHLKETSSNALLVTRDSKDDWWRLDKRRNLLGPRVELVAEYAEEVGGFFMTVHPERLLEVAQAALDVTVSQDTIDDARRISTSSNDNVDVGWTLRDFELLLDALDDRGLFAQAIALRTALVSGGRVTRDEIYEITGRDPAEHKLTGFTKPILRVLDELVGLGELPSGLIQPLVAIYKPNEGRADGFVMPSTVFEALSRGSNSRRAELLSAIAESAGLEMPAIGTGGTIPSEFFSKLGAKYAVIATGGPATCAAICQRAGVLWTSDCQSTGNLVTNTGLSHLLMALAELDRFS